ncbi:tyrosine-type recombinase/integrase [Saccharothrix algeriensis]|uniref:Integrase/recombinase XerC n=2 Tax=Saccharothrix algeriensis TaxID=173560 RepID=A0ABS2S260_9PSEU|nr:phage integrase N-terminal SAM-like domain-containing protein [Saccharothrix algeriensis]MBM7810332.1 integrase/recombinase XerC [Saccharothrix algeriensis]
MLAELNVHLDRCGLAPNTIKAYRRQAATYLHWLTEHADDHPDALSDPRAATAAVTAWQQHLTHTRRLGPSTVNQASVAVTLFYEHCARLPIQVRRVRIQHPGRPTALTMRQQTEVERASIRRGERDAAIIAVLLYTGLQVADCARLNSTDVFITGHTGHLRQRSPNGKTSIVQLPEPALDRVVAWGRVRKSGPGPLWLGQRGRLTVSGITQVVLAVGNAAGIDGLRPQWLRHTYTARFHRNTASGR